MNKRKLGQSIMTVVVFLFVFSVANNEKHSAQAQTSVVVEDEVRYKPRKRVESAPEATSVWPSVKKIRIRLKRKAVAGVGAGTNRPALPASNSRAPGYIIIPPPKGEIYIIKPPPPKPAPLGPGHPNSSYYEERLKTSGQLYNPFPTPTGNPTAAEALLERELGKIDDAYWRSKYLYALAMVEKDLRKYAEAEVHFKELLRLYNEVQPTYVKYESGVDSTWRRAYFHASLADILWQQNKEGEAHAQCRRAQELSPSSSQCGPGDSLRD